MSPISSTGWRVLFSRAERCALDVGVDLIDDRNEPMPDHFKGDRIDGWSYIQMRGGVLHAPQTRRAAKAQIATIAVATEQFGRLPVGPDCAQMIY
jgi:hypothetical protein